MTAPRQIVFLSKGANDASTRYRATQFTPLWNAAGFSVEHLEVPRTAGDWFAARSRLAQADAVVVLRRLFPDPLCWLLRRFCRRLIFDFDDAVFCRDTGAPSAGRQRRFRSIINRADLVWAGNDYLAQQAAQSGGRRSTSIVAVPTAVDPSRYEPGCHSEDGTVLVWIGSSSTRKYLEAVLPALDDLAERLPTLRLKVIADFDLPSRRIPIDCVRWSAETEAAELASSHIGLAPLPDDSWTRGKCGCKVLQYMASSLPVVSSDMPVHRGLLGDHCGLFAAPLSEWTTAIETLVKSPDVRSALGHNARQRVIEELSLDVVFEKMLSSLEALLSGQSLDSAA